MTIANSRLAKLNIFINKNRAVDKKCGLRLCFGLFELTSSTLIYTLPSTSVHEIEKKKKKT